MAATDRITDLLGLGDLPAGGGEPIAVTSPWDGAEIARVEAAGPARVDAALAAAAEALAGTAAFDRAERAAILARLADGLEGAAAELATLLVLETGKTIRDCRAEVARAVATARACERAALELVGEVLPLDAQAAVGARFAWTLAEPLGVVVGMNAVNYPLLIAVHKLGPAIGAGCPILIKPPDRAPLSTLALARLARAAGWPAAAVAVLPGGPEVGIALTTDERVRLISFTGSSAAGRAIARQAVGAELILELGSNAATIVDRDADLDLFLDRCLVGGFTANGQSCISVQRVFVHRDRYEDVLARLAPRVAALRAGDPMLEENDVGPVVDDRGAAHIAALLDDARSLGGEVLVGGGSDGRLVEPTLVAGLREAMRLNREEAFGPLVAVGAFDRLERAIAAVNASPYGLQAGAFTGSLPNAMRLIAGLEVGGVHINETSTFRPDHMPYGGVKESGTGKEGPRYVMERMTHFKSVSIRTVPATGADG
ncbi:MAG: aldehyde dehydrogenase family protein [Actinobacteria bacterium]|nr:aldehyde dehydrogenase family protein [Actinomycetota bacterium]